MGEEGRKRVLVTGGTGSIGKQVLKLLAERSNQYETTCLIHKTELKRSGKEMRQFNGQISLIQGDITDIDSLHKATKNQDYVIHLAGVIPPLADKKPNLAYSVNVEGTQNLIHSIEENSPNAFVLYASSISVYGDRVLSPEIRMGDPERPSYGDEYGKTKLMTEKAFRDSKLSWSIFRLTGIMDPTRNKPEGVMFHVPLNTSFEICTTRDCGRAFVNALEKKEQLNERMFNLGGGEACRGLYKDILGKVLEVAGLGKLDFPETAFATANFHCGYYMDGHELEDILCFRQDTKEDYFNMVHQSVPGWQRKATILLRPVIKKGLLMISDPYWAVKKNDLEGLKRYFNHEGNPEAFTEFAKS